MPLTTAYRNRLAIQFIESFVTFVYKKRRVAELLTKAETEELSASEASQLSHFQRDITHDRGVFQIWRNLIQAEDGYTLAQIKTFLLNNRVAILAILRDKWIAEMAQVDALIDETTANATTEEQLAELPVLLAELDTRKAKRQMWRDLVIELRDKPEAEFAAEAEMD